MKLATKQLRTKAKMIAAGMGVLLLALAALMISKNAQAAGFETIETPQNTTAEDKVEVLEFFWLGCPHCYAFEPFIEEWEKDAPEHVVFVREAPALNPSWEQHSRGFYTAQLLGKEHEFVVAMFDAIHEKRQPMRDPKKIAELAGTLGMDEDKFLSTMKSFAVEGKLKQARDKAIKAGISSVPSVIVNGKYRVSSQISGGHEGIIDSINERVEFEKNAMNL